MAKSPLATESYPAYAGNYSPAQYRKPITEVTVHHMAGVLSAQQCGSIFQRPGRNGSAHYGIGNGGEIANYVDESCVAWTNSNWDSNCRAVTIETSNSATGGDWPVGDAAYNSLIKLVADIAKRNNLGTLVPGKNLTWHNMYASTTCPGPYLHARMQDIADRANKINSGDTPAPTPAPSTDIKVGDTVLPIDFVDYNGTRLAKTRDFYYVSEINGDRAVLRADAMDGTVYAAVRTSNLKKVNGTPAPAPTPAPAGFKVGDVVVPTKLVDYNGTPLVQYDDTYTISEISGDRAVLMARGAVWAAMNTANLRKA